MRFCFDESEDQKCKDDHADEGFNAVVVLQVSFPLIPLMPNCNSLKAFLQLYQPDHQEDSWQNYVALGRRGIFRFQSHDLTSVASGNFLTHYQQHIFDPPDPKW